MLIVQPRQDEFMFGYFLIVFLVLAGPLAYFFGVDSRIDEGSPTRRFRG